jgi:putative nucleotidyltransferase with HDIG domain
VNVWERLEALMAPGEGRSSAWFHGSRIALAVVLAFVTHALFPASPVVDFPLYEIGSVAPDPLNAPFAFTIPKDEKELERERADVAKVAQPVFNYIPAAADSARERLTQFMQSLGAAAEIREIELRTRTMQAVADSFGVRLTPAEAEYLAPLATRQAIDSAIRRAYIRWLVGGVAPAGALDSIRGEVILRRGDSTRTMASDSIITFNTFLNRARMLHPDPNSRIGDALYERMVTAFYRPTIVFDRAATDARRDELRRSVSPNKYEVRHREKIVGANEVVGQAEHEKMRALRDEIQRRKIGQGDASRMVGSVLFNTLVIAIFGITLLLFRPQLYASVRALALVALVMIIVIGAAAIVAHMTPIRPELIPVAIAAITFSIMFDPRISMIAAMILAVLMGGQSDFRATNALFINLIGGVAAAFSVRVIRRRNQAFYSILTIAGAYAVAALAIGLTLNRPFAEIIQTAGWGTVNAVVSVMFAMQILLPLAEEFTGIDTYPRLLEWSDLNRPLMRQLSLEAPGTYAHTMAIANLAEAAANAIGANALLARVGAYYHDIGKLKKPQYFVENQPKGRNPHDMLKPSTSATIIRNHVKEGLELAAEHRLPKSVRAFITEHHGTGAISYFFEKAKERDGPPANPGEYAYPGPLPQTAETAIVMLADGVEAATRVLNDPTPQKIRDVIDHIAKMRIDQGQLRHAPLTLRQLDMIKEQFSRVLIGMHHNRIDYPAAGGGVTAEFTTTQ